MYMAGISLEQFGKLNMRQIKYISNAYSEKQREEFRIADVNAFIQGRYMVDALLTTVGNMLGGKNAKFDYPEKAYTMMQEDDQLTEDEIQQQRELFIASLQAMERNFKLSKEKTEKEKGSEQ